MRIPYLLLLPLLLLACQKEEPATGPPPAPVQAPLPPRTIELTTAALPVWRAHKAMKPALVLMSFDPFLKPVPAELKQRAGELVLQGSADDFDRHGSYFRADPVILPNQTLSAALDAGLFSKIYWIFPSKVPPEQLDLAFFRKQMTDAEFFTAEEAAGLTLKDAAFSGTLRGIPFQASHHQVLPTIDEPLILHIDLGFFRGRYDNEIKTPLYDLLHQTANGIFQKGWKPMATTLSYSTLEGDVALETRFVLSNLAEILRRPDLLENDLPEPWKLRAEALYAADMFTESKKLELYRQAAELAPEDATALYDLFQAHFQSRDLARALATLDQTVALDPGYAASYLALADMADKENNLNVAFDLLTKAKPFFPHNPFIDLRRADLLLRKGDAAAALELIEKLGQAPWSPIYRPEIPGVLERMRQAALAPPSAKEKPDAR